MSTEASLSARDGAAMARLFKALASPVRVRLLGLLRDEERCVHELVESLDLEQSRVSHQLRVLRNLRVVRARADGRHVFYSLDDEHIQRIFDVGLQHVRHLGA